MPYTLSHAVVALPIAKLSKHNISAASVIIGAMSPDFPYMLALTPTYAPGHSLTGPFLYCLIPSLLILLVWHRWLEKPNKALFALPATPVEFNAKTLMLTGIGVLIGAYSHALWDATSHGNGALVINSEFWNQALGPLPLFKWNQYLSGIIGLGILGLWYLSCLVTARNQPYQGKLKAGLSIYGTSILFFIVIANWLHGFSSIPQFAVRSALGFMVGVCIAAIVYAGFIHRCASSCKSSAYHNH